MAAIFAPEMKLWLNKPQKTCYIKMITGVGRDKNTTMKFDWDVELKNIDIIMVNFIYLISIHFFIAIFFLIFCNEFNFFY